MSEQTKPEGPFQATPSAELERQIMDPNVPKMEREWWAAEEITRLRADLEKSRWDHNNTHILWKADWKEAAALRAQNAELVANLKRMLLEFDFLVERGVIPDVRNDIIFANARVAIAKVEKEPSE